MMIQLEVLLQEPGTARGGRADEHGPGAAGRAKAAAPARRGLKRQNARFPLLEKCEPIYSPHPHFRGGGDLLEIARGFRVGEKLIPWGTTLADAARMLGQSPGKGGWPLAVPCAHAYGLPTLFACPSSPRPDRPVLYVRYDLADIAARNEAAWAAAAIGEFGPPQRSERRPLPEAARPEDSVVLNANWTAGDFGIGLSVYGAPRRIGDVRSSGALWISWSEDAAAAPYLDEWRSRSEELAEAASGMTELRTYALAWPADPAYGSGEDGPEDAEARLRRHRRICLYAPDLLATPERVSRRLDRSSFAIWVNATAGLWCASTLWESRAHALGRKVVAEWVELLPAKGAGYSMLQLGRWRVMSRQGSTEIAGAVEMLRRLPGVRIDRHEGFDC